MPAPAPALPPVAVQVAVIGIGLNSTMFLTFLMGLCSPTSHLHWHNLTVFRDLYNGLLWHCVLLWQACLQLWMAVFFNDLIIIVTRKGFQATVVIASITVLYLLSMAQLAIGWQMLQSSFVNSGETRASIFIATFFTPAWAQLTSDACTAATNIVADGLLVSTTSTIPFKFQSLKAWKDLEMLLCMGSVTSRHLLTNFLPCRRDRWDFIWENKEPQLSKLIPSQRDIHNLDYNLLCSQTNSIC